LRQATGSDQKTSVSRGMTETLRPNLPPLQFGVSDEALANTSLLKL